MPRQHTHKDQQTSGTRATSHSTSRPNQRAATTVSPILQLQRTLGNQAVLRLLAEGRIAPNGQLIQTKLTVGAPGDVYEQEADRVAQQVVNMPDAAVQREESLEDEEVLQAQFVQREEELEDEELLQAQFVQREDELEDEELLQAQFVQREEELEDEELLQAQFVQREDVLEDEDLLQAKADAEVPEVTSDVESLIEQKRGGGQPLPDSTREFFEPRFGRDFTGVKVHTDSQADLLNRDLQARAFATGSDIFFRSGEYDPESSGGRKLLAHEIAHVVQQGGATRISRELKDERQQKTKKTDEDQAAKWKHKFSKNGEEGQLTEGREHRAVTAYVPGNGEGKMENSGITIGVGIEVRLMKVNEVDTFADFIGLEGTPKKDFIEWLTRAINANLRGKDAYNWLKEYPGPTLTSEQAEATFDWEVAKKTKMAKRRLTTPEFIQEPKFRLSPQQFDELHPFVKELLTDIAWNSAQFAFGREDVIAEKLYVLDTAITPQARAIQQLRGLRGFVESLPATIPKKDKDGNPKLGKDGKPMVASVQGKAGRQKRIGWIDAKIAQIEAEGTSAADAVQDKPNAALMQLNIVQQGEASRISRAPSEGKLMSPAVPMSSTPKEPPTEAANQPTDELESSAYSISVAGIRSEKVTEQQATTLLWQAVAKLQERYQTEKQSHRAWLRANEALGMEKYPVMDIWYGPKLAIIDGKLALRAGQIEAAHELLQKAEQRIEVTTERSKQPIVDEADIQSAETAVVVLEFVKDFSFGVLETEYPWLAPVIEGFASEIGESLAGVQDDQESTQLWERLLLIPEKLLAGHFLDHEITKDISTTLMAASRSIISECEKAKLTKKDKRLSPDEIASIMTKHFILAATGFAGSSAGKLAKSSLTKG